MQELRYEEIYPGAAVYARGERWHVRQTRPVPDGAFVELEGADAQNQHRNTTLLLPFDRIDPIANTPPIQRRRDAVGRGILRSVAAARPAHALWSAGTARIDVLPWQLAPALAVVGGTTRLLLADAVGLGKTVQAGLILAELHARGVADRVLVLAPAAVRTQWADELHARFHLPVRVLDLPAILELEQSGPVGANPWTRTPVVVSSIDLVKRSEVCAAVECAPLDVLVVDEAHHATPGTDRWAIVARLARQVPWVVLVTATPHSGDARAYRALLAIGEDPEPAPPPMRIFRRSHGDVRLSIDRHTRVLRVRPSPDEHELQTRMLAYARDLCRGPAARTAGVHLLASVLARRATSSPWAARVTLARRLERLTGCDVAAPAAWPQLPWEETEGDGEDGAWLGRPGLSDGGDEQRRLRDLIGRADRAHACWSKLARLRRLVQSAREPVIVFSEFRDTLDACLPALEAITSVACLHGGLDAAERQRRLAAFVSGPARVLLTTDVAGEGLNLHEPARLVITIEWPWSPRRLEQRIGRVHRLGQQRAVHAIHLTARDSYEETVVARLVQRAARADAELAGAQAAEREVASLLLGVELVDEDAAPASPGGQASYTFEARARAEAARLVKLRSLSVHGRPLGARAVWAAPRRGAGGTRVVVVIEVTDRLPSGWVRGTRLVPVAVTLRERPAARADWRGICQRLATDSRLRQAAVDAVDDNASAAQWGAVGARLAALWQRRHAAPPRAMQPSLFDRRALRDAEQLITVRDQWDQSQGRTAARLLGAVAASTTRVLAVIPLSERRR